MRKPLSQTTTLSQLSVWGFDSSPKGMAAVPPLVKRYSVPILLLSLGLFFQLVVLPSSFPPSHYDVLGVRRYASVEEVTEAYEKQSSKFSGSDLPATIEFVKIRYAFELLTNPLWKRDYDLFGIDEQLHVIETVKGRYDGNEFSKIDLPLLDASISDSIYHGFNVLTSEVLKSIIGDIKPVLIQVYSTGSHRCAQFISSWKRIASLLDGVANTGTVDLGDVQLASYLAERKFSKQPFFRNGLPALVAFPPNCRSSDCYVRYQGDLSVDAVVDWIATTILRLPRIPYYSKESLVQNFIMKTGQHKVKVICFSKTGERAAPFLRQAANDYWAYASFAFVLWREEDSSIWWNMFHVESAPAFVFLKDPRVKPVIYYGNMNSSQFLNIMEENKHQELPQLRSVTSMELGCDARGYSRAGNDTMTWYCVILAGRPSLELSKMRETMRRAQRILADDVGSDNADKDNFSVPVPAAAALRENRLSFAWLDGEAQKKYCFFYVNSESSYETCGPRRDLVDVPKLIIVRYKRNSTLNDLKVEKKVNTMWDTLLEKDTNLASQLVARYNGSENIQEIIQWISQIIEDGDTRELPYYIETTPELVPEDANRMWSKGAEGVLSTGKGIKERVKSIAADICDYLRDPRVGPIFLLGACISFGTIWLHSSQTTQPNKKIVEGTAAARTRRPKAKKSGHDQPSSIADAEPKDAYQLLPTDSDTE